MTVNGVQDLHLLGSTGDYNGAGAFIATFFGRSKPEFGITDQSLLQEVAAAETTVDPAQHVAAQQVSRDLMTKYLPVVPLSSSPSALVTSKYVSGLVPSALTDERFYTASKNKG